MVACKGLHPFASGLFVWSEMKLIPLTRGLFAKVSDSKYAWLNQWKWGTVCSHGNYYAVRAVRSDEGRGYYRYPQKIIYMSHLITGALDSQRVDHRDGDTLNNTSRNLRICTHSQNAKNRKVGSNNTSGYKGIAFYPKIKKWRARIGVDGRRINLGYFNSETDAITAYNKASKKYHGRFGRLNAVPTRTS